MSRYDDERELRKLEYLKRRGVVTFGDELRRKELARKMASEDFEDSEVSREKNLAPTISLPQADKNGETN